MRMLQYIKRWLRTFSKTKSHTSEQKEIFEYIKSNSGHLIIDAVAGSGKTTTIIECINYIPNDKLILFCAFNKKIRDEISNRTNDTGKDLIVKNLHQLGFELIKQNRVTCTVNNKKYRNLFRKLKEGVLKKLLSEYEEVSNSNPFGYYTLSDKDTYFEFENLILNITEKVRSTFLENDSIVFKELLLHYNLVNFKSFSEPVTEKLYTILFEISNNIIEEGNRIYFTEGIIDYTDMLYIPGKFKYESKFKFDYLFIDECQDLSKSQLEIAFKYKKSEGTVIAVGDPKQSIYGFTGADVESFYRISERLEGHSKLKLSYCFRCPDKVIELAKKYRSDIRSYKLQKGCIKRIKSSEITKFISSNDLVLSRTHDSLAKILITLISSGKNIKIDKEALSNILAGINRIFKKEEIETIDIFREDPLFFKKIEERRLYIINKSIRNGDEADVADEIDYVKKMIELLQNLGVKNPKIKTLKELIELFVNRVNNHPNAIELSTIHSAKGLERDNIFILDYNKLPAFRSNHSDWEREQEKNLTYVALTRAKKNLYLVE